MAMFSLVFCIGFGIFSYTLASTHWLVTENGRIEAQVGSIFYLKRPHDFMALVEQERRAQFAENLRQELVTQKEIINRNDRNVDLESNVYNSKPECKSISKKSLDFDWYESTAIRSEAENAFWTGSSGLKDEELRQPNCVSAMPLQFSMHSFEHLDAMRKRANLTMNPEQSLVEDVKLKEIDQFGHRIAATLDVTKDSSRLYDTATLYWRIKGNALNAIECARRSLHLSPRKEKNVPLLNLGNILHQCRQLDEAAIVLHAALDHNISEPVIHYTLANLYGSTSEYNRSIIFYGNVVNLQSTFADEAATRKHDLSCHLSLEQALETQHALLQQTLVELRTYQKRYEVWLNYLIELTKEQQPVEEQVHRILPTNELKWKQSIFGEDCYEYQENGLNIISCNVNKELLEEEEPTNNLGLHVDQALNLESLLKNAEIQAEKLNEMFASKNGDCQKSSPANGKKFLPTKPALYDNPKTNMGTAGLEKDWPAKDECPPDSSQLPHVKEFPVLFLPPENKGYDVKHYLTSAIGLELGVEHASPWYPPICEKLSGRRSQYDDLIGLKERVQFAHRKPDLEIKEHLLSYVDNVSEFAEIGQRIVTALKKNAAPTWLLQVLASFYWRAHGNAYNSIECLRHAFLDVPHVHRDVVLVNLAALTLQASDSGASSVALLREAFAINKYEPATNFLLANAYVMQGNLTGAMLHYQKALQSEPNFPYVADFLKSLICYVKYYYSKSSGDIAKDAEQCVSQHHCSLDDMANGSPSRFMLIKDLDVTDPGKEITTEYGITDDSLPSVIIRVQNDVKMLPLSFEECQDIKKIDWQHFMPTWLDFTSKGIDLKKYISPWKNGTPVRKPVCDTKFPSSVHTLDTLAGVAKRKKLPIIPETALNDVMQGIVRDEVYTSEQIATQITVAIENDPKSWVLYTAAALYWRVAGDSNQAVTCLRQALHYAPYAMKDVPLLSLANIMYKSGLYKDALIVANMALEVSPNHVVNHFTIGNIYAAKGNMEMAADFFQSTLSLQPMFEPAKDRLRSIQCRAVLRD